MIVKIVNGHFFGRESVNVYKETEKSGQLIFGGTSLRSQSVHIFLKRFEDTVGGLFLLIDSYIRLSTL